MKRIKQFVLVALVVAPFLVPSQTQALGGHKHHVQGPNSGGSNGGGGTSAPIDGGIAVLLAAGIGFGAKKVYDMNKKKQSGVI